MQVREIMQTDTVATPLMTTITAAAALMRERNVGDLILTKDADSVEPVGIITDRDLVVGILAFGLDPDVLTVGDISGPELFVVRETEDADRLMERMRIRGIRRVPVVDVHGMLKGIFTLDDYLDHVSNMTITIRDLIGRQLSNERHYRQPAKPH